MKDCDKYLTACDPSNSLLCEKVNICPCLDTC